ncbi:RecName: Full Probable protein phosphatase 2C 51 Short [Tripterygium wilfordii]|uniref:RecName: Full Probable protein phosphatase 2C 51 Short n=2 Tax=Tripterygium wilfordii TaxID=458696 RepID=A0A7J7CNP8_TRIWF|nr:probable protein phosphatase 2C 51 isoform X2 [Tripterygium wilfordii]KAF5735618.1 RecName: Full Probable protein phosphatase 2C 51 Short [Tripterygium wilfordii]
MAVIKVILVIFALFLLCALLSSTTTSVSSCTAYYNDGGAAAVFQSPECGWSMSYYGVSKNHTMNCQSATLQGRRDYQEDRILCDLDVKIPFSAKNGLNQDMTVGIAAIFDGHGGSEASEMASRLFIDFFRLHTHFIREEIVDKFGYSHSSDQKPALDILKEALVRTIHDIDYKVTKEASKFNFDSGSTATVALLVDGQVLVAGVGDSKALLCSEKPITQQEIEDYIASYEHKRINGGKCPRRDYGDAEWTHLSAKELTRDHHPDRDDERLRIESAGGFVTFRRYDVPRVIGQLAVSRAIGDLRYKPYGVIAEPEVTEWQPLDLNDKFLVVSSDGIFERLNPQNVCDLLPNPSRKAFKLFSSCQDPECILEIAFEEGSSDNLSVIVIPIEASSRRS